jgi:hypothetical protein
LSGGVWCPGRGIRPRLDRRSGMAIGLRKEVGGSERGWRERFESLVERQAALYGALDALSQRQTELVDAGDAEGVLAILRQRQTIVEEIVSVAEEARPYRDRLASEELEPEARERLSQRVGSIERLASEISDRDERDRRSLAASRERVAAELAEVGRGRRALNAYGAGGQSGAKFQDREG